MVAGYKLTFISLLFSIILFATACDEKIFTSDVDCADCYQEKPDSADIIVYLTFNDENERIPLVVYKNEVDNNTIEYVDTATGSPYYLYVPVNAEYSVKAKYKKGSKTIYAVDGDKLKIKHVSDVCDTDCWVIVDGIINVELKDF
ncbi:MAG: hypothetical protein JXJ22_08280 [Bacteroidales bacterium]|nr:hypothetical protein [Bacteroidales bacterium]